jgi:hypothetical protein
MPAQNCRPSCDRFALILTFFLAPFCNPSVPAGGNNDFEIARLCRIDAVLNYEVHFLRVDGTLALRVFVTARTKEDALSAVHNMISSELNVKVWAGLKGVFSASARQGLVAVSAIQEPMDNPKLMLVPDGGVASYREGPRAAIVGRGGSGHDSPTGSRARGPFNARDANWPSRSTRKRRT